MIKLNNYLKNNENKLRNRLIVYQKKVIFTKKPANQALPLLKVISARPPWRYKKGCTFVYLIAKNGLADFCGFQHAVFSAFPPSSARRCT